MPKGKTKKSRAAYNTQYAREHLHRVPLDLRHADYDEVKTAADASGESVNGFIKKAIRQRLDQGTEPSPGTSSLKTDS